MTPNKQLLVPVKKNEIVLGKPLPWPIYNADHKLLLNYGMVVTSEHQIDVLIEKGLFREQSDRVVGATSSAANRVGESQPNSTEDLESPDLLKLLPGDALQLQPMLEGQTERYAVQVIGVMKGKSVLVTAPLVEGKLIFVREAQPFLIRAFSGLNVYAFKSRVLKAQHTPFPYLHLAYPDTIKVIRIRKAMRAPVQLIVAISDKEGGRSLGAGRIVDLSVGGARIRVGKDLNLSLERLFLSFKVALGDYEEYVTTQAVVRSVQEEDDEQGRPVRVAGVQFDALMPQHRMAIMNLVYQHLLKEK